MHVRPGVGRKKEGTNEVERKGKQMAKTSLSKLHATLSFLNGRPSLRGNGSPKTELFENPSARGCSTPVKPMAIMGSLKNAATG